MSGKSAGINSSFAVLKFFIHMAVNCRFVEVSHYYCRQLDITMNTEPEQLINLYPSPDPAVLSKPIYRLRCKWRIHFPIDKDAMFVLSKSNDPLTKTKPNDEVRKRRNGSGPMVPTENLNSPKIQYQVLLPTAALPNSTPCSSHAVGFAESLKNMDSFNVLPLSPGSKLMVTYDQDLRPNGRPPPGLMIQLMHKDFCGTDIVSFKKRCYRNSESSRTLEEELRFINQDNTIVQLASFKSSRDIQNFLNTSKLTVVGSDDQQRLKVPLNLTQSVRIGLFLEKKTGRIRYLSKSDGQCGLKEIEVADTFPFRDVSMDPTHACGSLRVDAVSGREVVEFRDCSEKLPALISFPETPMKNCSNCSEPVLRWIASAMAEKNGESNSCLLKSSPSVIVVVLVAAASVAIVSVGAVVPTDAKFFRRRREASLSLDNKGLPKVVFLLSEPDNACDCEDCEDCEDCKIMTPVMMPIMMPMPEEEF